RVWDTFTWQPKAELKGAAGLSGLSPDGLTLVSDGRAGLLVWDARSLQLLHTLSSLHLRRQWGNLYGSNLAFSRHGRFLAALVADESGLEADRFSLRIWEVSDLRQRGLAAPARKIWFPEVASVIALTLSADGKRVAASTVLDYLGVWDTSTG